MKPQPMLALACLIASAYLGVSSQSTLAASPPNDPHYDAFGSWGQEFDDQWALKQQRIYTDLAPSRSSKKIIVAIIDTGLDYTHPDLAAEKIWHNSREKNNGRDDDGNGYVDDLIGWNFVNNDNNPWDLSGHGTHIGGVIAACTNNGIGIAGISSQAQIMVLKVANFIGQARSASVASAIYYAVDQGARVINLSLGSELVTDLEIAAAQYAQQRDVLIIVAAGNRGVSTQTQGYPKLPGVLVVGASDQAGVRAGFSNFGAHLSLLAPGVDVLSLRAKNTDFIALSDPLDYPAESAVVGEDKNYYRASGTSFSAAIASGIAAQILSHRPDLSSFALREILIQSATDVAPAGVDQLSGYGQLNYISALSQPGGKFIYAQLQTANLELEGAALLLNLVGSANAAEFSAAEIQLRAAPNSIVVKQEPTPELDPYHWQTIAQIDHPVASNSLGQFSITRLTKLVGGSQIWELRLVVTDQSGALREAYMSLQLPAPQDPFNNAETEEIQEVTR